MDVLVRKGRLRDLLKYCLHNLIEKLEGLQQLRGKVGKQCGFERLGE